MKKQEAIEKLRGIKVKLDVSGYGPEEAHLEADLILMVYLRSQGEKEMVDAYEAIPKWYS